jgi:threonine aldolase
MAWQSAAAELSMTIDLRSDTVTRPTPDMLRAMADAEVGDDVFGDDPAVNRLQTFAAELVGCEAMLWFPSGTQSNLAALMSHCGRGDEYLVGQEAHTYRYEGGGAAVLGSIQPQPLPNRTDGSIALCDLEAAIKPDDAHFARTRLITLENTISGRVLPPAYVTQVLVLAARYGLSTHLDGARVCNAAVAQNLSIHALCNGFDSISICLSKGLGAPAGTLLGGCREFIARAHRCRKLLGGGMRQIGSLAAAGLHALTHHVARLADDHANAVRLSHGLTTAGFEVTSCHTNMVFMRAPAGFAAYLGTQDIKVLAGEQLRLVTHLDVNEAGIERVLRAARGFQSTPRR